MPKVLNKRHNKVPHDAVYVGRPSKWGNPFVIGANGTRSDVVYAYECWLLNNEDLMDSLHDLRGKDLVCWCAPQPCHADVLLKYAND